MDTDGDVCEIIMDPHIQRGVTPRNCQLCGVLLRRDQDISADEERRKILQDEQRSLSETCASSTPSLLSFTSDTGVTAEEKDLSSTQL